MRAYLEQADRLGCLNTSRTGCTPPLVVLPLRYAVVGLDENDPAQAGLPLLPAQLALGLPRLQRARYVVRTLRAGYLYVFHKQRGQWHVKPMQMGDNGRMWTYHPDAPPPANALAGMHQALQRQAPDGSGKSQIGATLEFGAPDQYEEVRLLYTPDPLTSVMQERYRTESALRDTLQWLNVRQQANKYKPHLDTLASEQIGEMVLDYRLRTGKVVVPYSAPGEARPPFAAEAEAALRKQLYPLDDRFLPPATTVQMGIVLHDPIGITQELNAWRNAATEQLKDWLEYENKAGVSNERLVTTAQAFGQVRELFQQRRAAIASQHEIDIERARVMDPGIARGRGAVLNDAEERTWNEQAEAYLHEHAQVVTAKYRQKMEAGEYARVFETRYAKSVKTDRMRSNLDLFAQQGEAAQKLADRRAPDHRTWLQSAQLHNALDAYDDADTGSGWCFAHQTGLCVMGLDGDADGAKLLDAWWSAPQTDRPNLALRGITLNQAHIQQALAQTIERAKPPDTVGQTLDAMQSALKQSSDLLTQFGAADAYLDTVSTYSPVQKAGALAWVGSLGRQVLRTSAPNFADRALNHCMSVLLAALLGPQAVEMRLAEHARAGRAPAPGRVRQPVMRALEKRFVDNVTNAHKNDFYKVRAGGVLLFLQAGLLLMQGRQYEEQSPGRFWSEFVAGGLAAAGAGHELLAVGTEHVLATTAKDSVAHRGAQISLGRFRLWGATLSGVAGVVSIGWDMGDASKSFSQSKSALGTAYTVRVLATGALILGQGGAAFAVAGPLFKWLADTTEHAGRRAGFLRLAGLSSRLAANDAAMLLLGRMTFYGTVIITVATIAIAIFDDDALEKWCDRCCYRLRDDTKLYSSMEDELGDLFGTLEEIA
ncbi:hypothetical protein JI752_007945 [Lysobacter sp. MMG2]|uniref:T6SS effector BTH_I2691 family protein n=1 Tax=Lysobacter sp. MMG2 TaxID=2801338 RepID=UPI001C2105C3|nr:T6SS effector BTH_I2691 family protein [Lysobacter sp. MMG2]MBU8976076.1 hypothetical protein [Lysobacter sp. MMG2]